MVSDRCEVSIGVNICGWVSDVIYKGNFIGWLLDPLSTEPRDAIVVINDLKIEVRCDGKRIKPKQYKDHLYNGFCIAIDRNLLSHLKSKNKVTLIDKVTNQVVAKSILKVDLQLLEASFSSSLHAKFSSSLKVFGKLNSKLTGFKILGWLAKEGAKDDEFREAVVKFPDGIVFSAVADVEREELKEKGVNGGKAGFVINVPPEVLLKLPETFEVTLWDKRSNQLIDKVLYKNYLFFEPYNFEEYIKYSMLNPVVYAPFSEKHKRCFAVMENIASKLENNDSSILVSVIMPTFNRADVIVESINSVLAQSYNNFELIIIDDGSNDNTVAVVKSIDDPRIRFFINETNLGCSYSRNLGVRHSRGRYVFYLDSDNIWDPRYLKVMVGAFCSLSNASAIYSGQFLFKGNSDKCFAVRFASFNPSLLENRNYIDLNCFGHTREAFESLGGFNTELKRLIDYDFILRLSKKFEIYSIPVLLSSYYFAKANNTITSSESFIPLKIEDYISCETTHRFLNVNVSAVIPNYENIQDLEKCISSLHDSGCSEIIVVDNNSSENCIRRLEYLESKGDIKLIKNSRNFGFTYAVNQGIHATNSGNDILLVNNDSFYTNDSVKQMQSAAYSLKNVGLIVPRQVLLASSGSINAHVPFANPSFNCDVNLSMKHRNIESVPLYSNGKNIELNFAPFFSVYIKRSVYNVVGDLDAQHGRHYRSDRVYCDLVRFVYKMKIYYVSGAVVYHEFQCSTRSLKQISFVESDRIVINNVWGDDEIAENGFTKKIWQR